jgi:hypothetical protein
VFPAGREPARLLWRLSDVTRIRGRLIGALALPALALAGWSNKQRAENDAAAILATFTAPSGARRLAAAPTAYDVVLKLPGERIETPA